MLAPVSGAISSRLLLRLPLPRPHVVFRITRGADSLDYRSNEFDLQDAGYRGLLSQRPYLLQTDHQHQKPSSHWTGDYS